MAIISSAFVLSRAFSYDSDIAHPNIAVLAAELYNKNTEQKLTQEEINLIRQGAFDEDKPIRWMNHFYDPTTGKGVYYIWQYQMSSKDWAQSPSMQEKFTLGDYSWQRAIFDYQHGNKKEALIGLGHTIHLISDAAVPAHTRNDPHETGDSYEQFVKHNWDILLKGLENVDKKIVYLNNLDAYFDNLANYANKNFYSDSTRKDKEYVEIIYNNYEEIDDGTRALFKSQDGISIYIKKINDRGWKSKILNLVNFDSEKIIKDPLVLISYTKYLLPKAIGHSAGIIDLFFEEVKKEQNFDFKKDRENVSMTNYLLGYIVEKVISLKGNAPKINAVLADENTVVKIMNENVVENAIAQEENVEQTDSIELVSVVTPQPKKVVTLPNTAVEEQFEAPVEILSPPVQLPKLESPKPVELKQEEHISGPHFVFGPGGEQNPPEPALTSAPIAQMEITQTTSTDETETPTSTEPIIEESPTSTEEIISDPDGSASGGETSTSTQPIIEEPFDSAQDETETPTSTEPIIEKDITPPNAPNLILTQNISTSTTSTVQLSWNSASEDVNYYNIEYQNIGEWQTLLAHTTSTAYKMDVEKFKTYTFRANATDMSTNTSAWAEKTVTIDWPKSVVINEIAWMGTAANKSSDEWLELYNNTDEDIDLTGWKIKVSGNYLNWDSSSSTINSLIIKARDYYLMERTNDDTIPDIKADATYKGALKNTGEDLILLNNNGEIIDQVDNSSSRWFAGQTETKYKTMERLSPNKPGTQASNWQTSDTYSVKGKAYGGARIYGTPRQPNQGYWYLQNLTTNYTFDENKTLILTAENSPYFIDDKTEIPAGYTLKLKEGVVIAGAFNSSYFDVKGALLIEGTEEKPVVFTSARDKNYINFNLTNLVGNDPEPGDWGRIEVSENGKLNANNVKFLYGGQKYFAQGGFVFGGKWPARIINNLGGEVSLDYAEFQNNFIRTDGTDQTYDALIWIEPATGLFTTTTINHSVFDGGYLAINNKSRGMTQDPDFTSGQNNYNSISNSTFKNFTNTTGPITSRYDLPIMDNNVFENNARDIVEIQQLTVNKDITLDSKVEYLMNIITINTGATLQILPGTIINLSNKGEIKVNGNLEAIGADNNKIIIRPAKADEKWGNIIFNNSTSTLEYVNITGGNNGSFNMPQSNGMLWMKDSNVILNNVSLTDARRPYNMIYSKDSKLKMTDSEISWSTPKESNTWMINGISLDGGSLYLNNTTFNQMDRGIEMYNFAAIEIANMTLGHFTNISDLNWWPINVIEL